MKGSLAAVLILAAAPLPAQTLARGDSLLAAGDTTAAIVAYDAAIRRDRSNAEAYHRAGLLYWARASSARLRRTNDSHIAVERFKDAVRIAPDSGRYVVTIAKLVRAVPTGFGDDLVVLMINAVHVLAQRRGAAASADLQFIARSFLDEFEIEGRRLLMTDATEIPAAIGLSDRRDDFQWERDAPWGAFVEFLRDNINRNPLKSSMAYIQYAEETLREAVRFDPDGIDAAGMLVVTLGEGDRWQEAHDVARRLAAAAKDSGRAHALLGLTLARLYKWRDAESAFDHAFGLMTPNQREPYQNLFLILNQADSIAWTRLPPVDRARADSLFWSGQRPLYLSSANEAKVEFWARLAYVQHRWSEPARQYQGFQDPRGAVYVRWGPPQLMATIGQGTASAGGGSDTPAYDGRGGISTPIDPASRPPGSLDPTDWRERARLQWVSGEAYTADAARTRAGPMYLDNRIVWAYVPERLRFLFGVQLWLGYSRAFFFGRFGQLYQETREKHPVSFDNVALVAGLDTLGVQVAQFRSNALDTTDVAVFTESPIGRMMRDITPMDIRLVTAAFVKDSSYRSVVERAVNETVRPIDTLQVGRPSFRLALTPGAYRFRVEAGMPVLGRAARTSSELVVRSFEGGGLRMSDILLAVRVTPRDSAARRWTDFFIDPSAGRFVPGAPIALLWEAYNLEPDSAGAVHYRVVIRLDARETKGRRFAARVRRGASGAVEQTAQGDSQVTLAFERRQPAVPGAAIAEYLELDLQSDDEGTYEATVTITDVQTGQTTSASRLIIVSKTPLRK